MEIASQLTPNQGGSRRGQSNSESRQGSMPVYLSTLEAHWQADFCPEEAGSRACVGWEIQIYILTMRLILPPPPNCLNPSDVRPRGTWRADRFSNGSSLELRGASVRRQWWAG